MMGIGGNGVELIRWLSLADQRALIKTENSARRCPMFE